MELILTDERYNDVRRLTFPMPILISAVRTTLK